MLGDFGLGDGIGRDGGDDSGHQRHERVSAGALRLARTTLVARHALAIARNPFIWGCLIGIAVNLSGIAVPRPLYEFAGSLGRASLAIGLLWSGRLATRRLRRPNRAALVTVFLKLIVMPVIAITLGVALGLAGASLTVVACCASVPAASNAYVLARQMGGDAPLLAQIPGASDDACGAHHAAVHRARRVMRRAYDDASHMV